LLALAAGSPVPADSIVSGLWPDKDPPATAAGIVQTYISRLRLLFRLNDDHEKFISRDGSGYRLHITPEQLDLLAFRKIVNRAREAKDPEQACDGYEHAMRLWRGEPLADVELLRSHPATVALANEHVTVALEHAESAATADRHQTVLPSLKTLTASNKLDERLHAALMVALAGSGLQGEALRVYEDLRRRLDDELGMLPGDELRRAHQRVLRQEIVPVPRERTWRVVRQLPAAPEDFVGREAERTRVLSAITASDDHLGVPVAVISGQPGSGKTALALHAGHSASPSFPDGQLWVQLAGAAARPRELGEVLGEMLRALGVNGSAIPDHHSERSAALRSVLAGRKILVVADDAASVEQIEPLLPGTPGSAVIATSRVQLHGLPGVRHVPLDVLPADDAVSLLVRLVGAERAAANPAAAARLAEVCGGLPLALCIAGGKLAARPRWPLSAMVRKLTSAQSRLTELAAGNLSVRASIASSYTTLPERHRRVFRHLALLGPADFAAWVVPVLLGEPVPDSVLDELVDRSMVAPVGVDATGEPRYRLPDLLRDYAAEQLAAEGNVCGDR
jgi:DNA-binding SARP family transcriptional activator